eukprot:280498-Pyramimonas_sp.AAC.1
MAPAAPETAQECTKTAQAYGPRGLQDAPEELPGTHQEANITAVPLKGLGVLAVWGFQRSKTAQEAAN